MDRDEHGFTVVFGRELVKMRKLGNAGAAPSAPEIDNADAAVRRGYAEAEGLIRIVKLDLLGGTHLPDLGTRHGFGNLVDEVVVNERGDENYGKDRGDNSLADPVFLCGLFVNLAVRCAGIDQEARASAVDRGGRTLGDTVAALNAFRVADP